MTINSTFSSTPNTNVSGAYNDLQALNSINQLAKVDQGAAIDQVAKQFESILVRSLMKSMRDAGKVFSEDSYFSSKDVEFYQDMLDDQLSVELSQGQGLGFSSIMSQQLSQIYASENASSTQNQLNVAAQGFDLQSVTKLSKQLVESHLHAMPTKQAVGNKDNAKLNKASDNAAIDIDQFSSPGQFIETLYPLAADAAKRLGVDPAVLLAQSALETGWGRYLPQGDNGENSYNLFGIKANNGWQGKSVDILTTEFVGGSAVKVRQSFRQYDSYAESFQDYVNFIDRQARYQAAKNSAGNASEYVHALQDAGYATDPAYADKIENILARPLLQQAFLSYETDTQLFNQAGVQRDQSAENTYSLH